MRKEIIGILLFFAVLFTLISLLSYSPADPSIHHARAPGEIQNLFGFLGAHFAGLLVGLFGLGAFWLPLLLFFASMHAFAGYSARWVLPSCTGGLLLIIATGALLALQSNEFELFGSRFSSGGIVGLHLKTFLVRYANSAGGAIILVIAWLIGLILATGFSLIAFAKRLWRAAAAGTGCLRTRLAKWQERRQKAKKRRLGRKKENPREKVQAEKSVQINAVPSKPVRSVPAPQQQEFDFMQAGSGFQLPSVTFLEDTETVENPADAENLRMQSRLLEKKLDDFGVKGRVATITPGPVVTTFEYEPAPGVKINKIVNLTDDLALALRAMSIRIVAPIPGKAAIGVEIPNADRQLVRFKEIVVSSAFAKSKSKLTLCLGKDIVGVPVAADLDRMPHLLIAGATGSGKSVALNAMICSFLYKATPDDVRLIMIDPKRIELSIYRDIPHLITPVVTDPKKATYALFWAVREMERRYELLAEAGAKNIKQFNQKVPAAGTEEGSPERLPYIVIIIDELADLMMVASREVEVSLTRLAQMARAAGIHLILATQRPSVDVLTGIIKANFPTRLTFQVSSKTDSRTIIDTNGAESLLGNGDMLFLPPGTGKLQRIHGAFISEAETARVTDFLRRQSSPDFDKAVLAPPPEEKTGGDDEAADERYDEAVALVAKSGQASISMVQRHLRIGYNRAARIIEMMERQGVVGPSDGVKPREVLVRSYDDEL